jgi:catechol 2,3-dioxygenase-like lactoylglutathione lyase family enzyme
MPITLNHTIVPATDKEASARFFAEIMGLEYKGVSGHFAPVRVNETLTMDFDDRDVVESHHYAFKVDDQDFDEIFGRIQAAGLKYGSSPFAQDNMELNARRGGRGFYFKDPNGHSMELLTHD